jgi:hypothetical protein
VTDAPGSVYVYGVVAASDRTEIDAPSVGGGEAEIRRVRRGEIAAVVSDLPADGLAAARGLRAHWGVLEQLAERTTVLPVRFGTAMEGDDAVRDEFLAPNAERLEGFLEELEGKVQLSVKGFYDEERLLRDVVEGAPQVAGMRKRVQRLSEAAGYYERIRLGELVSQHVEQRRADDTQRVLDRLRPLAVAARADPPATQDGAVNAAFLVERDSVDSFSRAVKRLAGEMEDRMRIRYVGPLPPYGFTGEDAGAREAIWA